MATIPSVRPFEALGGAAVVGTVLGLTNVVTYAAARRQILFVHNTSASSVTVTLDGALAPTDYRVPGTALVQDLSTGVEFTVPAGAIFSIPLNTYSAYLQGEIGLASSVATGVEAWIIEV